MNPIHRAADHRRSVTIEIDELDRRGDLLVTLTSTEGRRAAPTASVVALTGHPWLEELPEVLRTIGLALVFDDPLAAHRAVGRLLRDLADAP